MEVKEITELPNGGAELVFDLTDKEVGILLSDAIYRALKGAIDAEEKRTEALKDGG